MRLESSVNPVELRADVDEGERVMNKQNVDVTIRRPEAAGERAYNLEIKVLVFKLEKEL